MIVTDLSNEIWKDIAGYEGLYQISNLGRVKSLPKIKGRAMTETRVLKNQIGGTGYWAIVLSKNGKKKQHRIHRLIATAFIKNNDNKPFINHIDGNKLNCSIENLEWCTARENTMHALENGLRKYIETPKGENVENAKLKQADVDYIRKVFVPRNKRYGINALSQKFNVERHTISKIIHNRTYKNWEN